MKVIAYDPYLTDERAKELEVEKVELDEAYVQADYITVHLPLTNDTKEMVDEAAFDKMKQGFVFLIVHWWYHQGISTRERKKWQGRCSRLGCI